MKNYISPEVTIRKFENEEVLGSSTAENITGKNETEIIFNFGKIF